MQYKVPQNIDMEDKIVGPLTLMQFVYLIFGGLIDYITYQLFYDSARLLFFIIAVPVTLITLALAFVKVYDRPFGTFIKHAISFARTPRERVWHKEEALEGTTVVSGHSKGAPGTAPQPGKQFTASRLEKLTEIIDTSGKPSQISNKVAAQPNGQSKAQKS